MVIIIYPIYIKSINLPSFVAFPKPTSPPTTTATISKPAASNNNDIFTELAGLAPPAPVITTPSYSGGILQPNSPISPSTSINSAFHSFSQSNPQSPQQQQKPLSFNNSNNNNNNNESNNKSNNNFADLDPYAALRDLSIGSKPATPTTPKLTNGNINGLKIDKVTDDSMAWGGKVVTVVKE